MPRLQPDPQRFPADSLLEPLRAALADGGPGAAVVVAEPGAGKTTRLPLALLDEPWCHSIVLTAPRRVAALAAAERLATTLGERVGQTVGVRMRDVTRVGPGTRLEVVTEGVLVRMLSQDPGIQRVSAVVLDEVHERSLDIDLVLALTTATRSLLRPDLRVVAMSATLDDARTAAVLGEGSSPPPVLRTAGRGFPIDVVHSPASPGRLLDDAARHALDSTVDGDVLVFLPGASEIRRTTRALERLGVHGRARVLALHGSGPAEDQRAALAPPNGLPRIVLATSIAQTSLTIPGVRTVIDSGLIRRSSFDPRSGLGRLVTEPVSRSTADQRAGRAGREAPGRCVRLWSAAEHARRDVHDPAEITTADLEPLALSLAAWGTHDPEELAWIDPPPREAWRIAVSGLQELGALDPDGRITPHGAAMASLPLEPRIGHLLLLARVYGPEVERRAASLAIALSRQELLDDRTDQDRSFESTVERLAARRDRSRAAVAVDELLALIRSVPITSVATGDSSPPSIAGLLSLVHPGRIAAREGADPGRYRLASGGVASMAESAPERGAPVIVVTDLDGDRRNGRIWSCMSVDAEEVIALHRDEVTTSRETTIVGGLIDGTVRTVEVTRLAGTVLRERVVEPNRDEIVSGVIAAIDRATIEYLLADASVASLCARVEVVRRSRPLDWPAMDADSLVTEADDWLTPALHSCPARSPMRSLRTIELLKVRIGHHHLRELDRLAPERITLPSGLTHPIDWTHEAGPTVTARVQELFGTLDGPRVVDGALAVRLELTSPAGRPAAVTDDLRRFWVTGYPLVRAELRGRYPKHPWPEDPTTAIATARVKPRPAR